MQELVKNDKNLGPEQLEKTMESTFTAASNIMRVEQVPE